MPRTPHEIDASDRQIIQLLTEDGRMAYSEIARRVPGLTARAARYRIEQLIERGIIRVRAIVDAGKVGFPVLADVWVEVDADQIVEVTEKLARLTQVTYAGYSTGDRDVIIQIVARDIDDLHTLLTRVVARVPGVRRTTSYIIPRVVKDKFDWPFENEAGTSTTPSGENP